MAELRHNAGMGKNATSDAPIGIFDSGVGGLTVLKAIRETLPHENLVYLGDTARLPYGTKSPASISRYAMQAASRLVAERIKLLVVACNTASAVALDDLRRQLGPLPVIGVVEPGADAAVAARPAGAHLVLATEATVRLAAYRVAIEARDPEALVREQACEMLVALAEEGWNSGEIAEAIVRRYLDTATADGFVPDSIILGCTHFPLLHDAIRGAADENAAIIDSASTTAAVVRDMLESTAKPSSQDRRGATRFLATDGVRRFARVGSQFLGHTLTPDEIELVDL